MATKLRLAPVLWRLLCATPMDQFFFKFWPGLTSSEQLNRWLWLPFRHPAVKHTINSVLVRHTE
jgi:hypothetical protein